jgi:hypothetical protein
VFTQVINDLQKISHIDVFDSYKNCKKTALGYFYDSNSSPIVWIDPVTIADFISIDEIRFVKINEILWKIEEKDEEKIPDRSSFLRPFHRFTLSRV